MKACPPSSSRAHRRLSSLLADALVVRAIRGNSGSPDGDSDKCLGGIARALCLLLSKAGDHALVTECVEGSLGNLDPESDAGEAVGAALLDVAKSTEGADYLFGPALSLAARFVPAEDGARRAEMVEIFAGAALAGKKGGTFASPADVGQ